MKTYRLNRRGLEVWKAGCEGPVPPWVLEFNVEDGFCGGLLDTDYDSGYFHLRVGDCIVKDGDSFFGLPAEYFDKVFEEETDVQDGCIDSQIKYLSKMLSDGNNDFDEHTECEEERQMLINRLEQLKACRAGKRFCAPDCKFYEPGYVLEEERAPGAYETMMEPPTCTFGGEPYADAFVGDLCPHDLDKRSSEPRAEHLMDDDEFFENYHIVVDPDTED